MRCRSTFLSSCIIVIISCCICPGYGQSPFANVERRDFIYPHFQTFSHDFAVLQPDIVLVTNAGGVSMAGTNVWYLRPSSERTIISASPNLTEESLYYVSVKKSADSYIASLRRLKKTDENRQVEEELATFASGDLFRVFPTGLNKAYLWQYGELNRIWLYDGNQKRVVYEAKEKITAFYPIDENSCLFAEGRNLLVLRNGDKAQVLLSLDEKSAMDGVCIDAKGVIYFSTYRGTWKLKVDQNKQNSYDLIAPKLHGQMKFMTGYLFVHLPKVATVVRLSIEN